MMVCICTKFHEVLELWSGHEKLTDGQTDGRRARHNTTRLRRAYKEMILSLIIGIKHVFPCINVCQVPRELLKTQAEGRGFKQLPRDLVNVNALEKQCLIAVIS